MSALQLDPILAAMTGPLEAPVMRLDAPLSFWGGVDPQSGRITQVRHPQCGESIAGTILCLPATIGSSSSSAILLELIRIGKAPAALVMTEPDAILLIGCVVGREMGWNIPPAFKLDAGRMASLSSGAAQLSSNGLLTPQT